MNVTGDRDICVGAGQCVLAAPEVFDQDEEGLVLVPRKQVGDDRREVVEEAATVCPSGAVRLTTSARTSDRTARRTARVTPS